jgi:transcriptional regulator with XRE-family HTH domain
MSHLGPEVLRRLRSRRVQLGLAQWELAERMGTSQSALCALENGLHDPHISTLHRWAGALGLRPRVDFDELDKVVG